jgi:hypothetical protein
MGAIRRPLHGTDKIALRADRVLRRRKVAKHFTMDIGEDSFTYARDQGSIKPKPPSTGSTCCAPESYRPMLRGRLIS